MQRNKRIAQPLAKSSATFQNDGLHAIRAKVDPRLIPFLDQFAEILAKAALTTMEDCEKKDQG